MCNAVFRTPFSRCPLDGSKLAALADDPLVGTTLDQRYVIEECIGEGGMGRVYRAKHTRMSRHYAIKVLFGDHAGDTRMRSRFAREAEAVSRLNHANVIAVLDFGETKEGLLFLVMDLAPGPSLAQLVRDQAPFTQARAIDILTQLSRGLAHAHGCGLVHRDFKCENVIMVVEEEREVPKIVDFGICMIIEDSPAQSMLTSNGMIMGTPAVMAPEQASGDKVDHRTDLFSLGIVGYQMLSGCLPFEGTPLDMARKNLYEPIPTIAQRSGVQVAPEVEAIIAGLTAKKPDDRFQSAKEVWEALRALSPGASQVSASDSNEWLATPTPATGYNLATPASNLAASQQHMRAGQVRQTPSHTPMVTEVPPGHIKPKRSPLILMGGAALAIAAGVLAVLAVGADSETSRNEPAKVTVVSPADQRPPDAAIAPENLEIPARTTGDAGGAGEAPDHGVTGPTGLLDAAEKDQANKDRADRAKADKAKADRAKADRAKADKDKADKAKAKADRAKAKADRAKARNNDNEEQADTPEALLASTLALYSTVNTELIALENAKGTSTASDLRAKFNKIDRSSLIRTPSTRPFHDKSLRRLRGQIRARMND